MDFIIKKHKDSQSNKTFFSLTFLRPGKLLIKKGWGRRKRGRKRRNKRRRSSSSSFQGLNRKVVVVMSVVVVVVVVVVVSGGGGGGGKVSRNGLSLSFYSYAMFDRKKVSTLI
jgi:hypothetical protein